jgi:hypothetical protein
MLLTSAVYVRGFNTEAESQLFDGAWTMNAYRMKDIDFTAQSKETKLSSNNHP